MNNKKLFYIAIVFQVLLLSALLVNSAYPLWSGETIRLRVNPVDPRSLFRGNYVRLQYDFSGYKNKNLRRGSTVYVELEQVGDWYDVKGYSLSKPENGMFIKATYALDGWMSVKAGIEAFFTTKSEAKSIENAIRRRDSSVQDVFAIVKVAPNGKAAIQNIEIVNK
jgi:uncharacterized membrane-anchored protein